MKKQICNNCGNYRAYYAVGYAGFFKTREGFCHKHKRASGRYASCEDWVDNGKKRENCKKACLETLYEMAERLSMITQILREVTSAGDGGSEDNGGLAEELTQDFNK